MKFLKTGLFTLWMVCSASLFAQVPNTQAPSPDEQAEASKYERYYEIVLENALAEYYKAGTFLVDVKASVDRVMVARDYEVVENLPPLEIDNLPGLPIVPPDLRSSEKGKDSLKVSGFDSSFRLNQLSVKVLIDTSYSDADQEFIQEAATMIANADQFRGDVVTVERKIFPRSTRDIPKEKAAKPKVQPDTSAQAQTEPAANEFLGVDWNNPKHLMYVIAGLGAILLGILLFMAFRKPKEVEQQMQYPMQPMPVSSQEDDKKEKEIEDEVREISSDKQAKFEADRMYVTNASVSNPKMISDLVEEWIEEDEEEGMVKAVRSIFSVDPKLMDVLQPHLSESNYESIQFGLSNLESIPIKEKAEEVTNFRKSIQQIKKKAGEDGESEKNLFDFVQQLTDQQLMHLVKGESDEMTAILLAQVAGERASYVLQKMEEKKRVSVLLKMGKISNIPISIYKRVASHFSSKALSVSDMKYVPADGVESILSTIDSLPVNEQEKFVQSIAEQDLDLAKKIRKYFVAFNDLPKMDDQVLQAALEQVQSEDLIKALYQAKDEIVQKVLSVRPKREQQLIQSELANVQDLKPSETEDARKEILMAIRQQLKGQQV